MKKIISAVFLALMAFLQIHAQDSDLRSAPDLPTFKVTLTVDNGTGGTLYEGNTSLKNGAAKYAYGTKKTITLVADKGKTLSSFLAGSDVRLPDVVWGEGSYPSQNTYTYPLTLDKETTFKAVWADKKKVVIKVTGTERIVSDKAAVVTVSTDVAGLTLTPAYYKEKACTSEATEADRKRVGTFYVKLSAPETVDYLEVDTVFSMNVVNKIGLTVTAVPAASGESLQGDALSTVTLTGGTVVSSKDQGAVPGTWAWTAPATILTPGTNAYQATFTPSNTDYAAITSDVTVKAKHATTVTVTQTTGGKVEIKTPATNGKYIGTVDGVATLEVWAIPDAGYRFKEWNNGIANPTEGAGSETAVIRKDIPATDNSTISAVFEKAERGLTVTNNEGGNLYVGDKRLSSGTNPFEHGTDITVTLVADPQKTLSGLSVNGVAQTLTPTFPTSGTYANRNVYTYRLGKLETAVTIVSQWKDKPVVEVTVSGTEQIVNPGKPAVVTVKTNVEGLTLTPAYYKDDKCTAPALDTDREKVGTYYVKLSAPETATYQAVDKIVLLKVTEKKPLGLKEELRVENEMLEGQILSSVAIPDGEVYEFEKETRVPGHWEWLNAGTPLRAGADQTYDAIYTPQDTLTYNKLEAKVKVSAKHVTTVYTTQSAGGYVYIENASVDNKYVGSTEGRATVTAKAVPYAGYKFVSWAGGTGTASEQEVTDKFVVPDNTDTLYLSATFEQATRKINLARSGSGQVNLSGVTNSQAIVGGTVVIEATPDAGNEVKSISYKLSTESSYQKGASFIVGGQEGSSYDVKVEFKAKQTDQFAINVNKVTNGSLLLKQGETVVAPGSSVKRDEVLTVIAMPDRGYELETLKQGDTDIVNGSITVTGETTISATFKEKSYPVTVEVPTGARIEGVTAGTKEFGSTIRPNATVTDANNYKLISLVVNNKPISNDTEITVDGPVHVTAQVRELIPIELLNTVDSVDYDGAAHSFVAKTINGLAGFSYTYSKENPTDAGEYGVTVRRPADDIYQAFEGTATLKINPVLPKVEKIPFLSEFKDKDELRVDGGTWHKGRLTKGMLRDVNTYEIYFKPDNSNYTEIGNILTVANDQVKAITVTLDNKATNGTPLLKIGDLPITDGITTYEGQVITLEAIPATGYRVDWSKINGLNTENHSVKLGSKDVTITVNPLAFVEKETPTANRDITITKPYTGSVPSISVKELSLTPNDSKWRISYQKDGSSAIPVTVDSYVIMASREEDDQHKASEIKAGTLTIGKATIGEKDITLPTATAIRKGNALSLSHLDGGLVKVGGNLVIGTFAWKNPGEVIVESGLQAVEFKPLDANYEMGAENLAVYVTLLDEPLRTMTLVSVNSGSVSITDATGASLATGAKVPQGSLIKIAPKDGSTIESVKVNDAALLATDGVYSYTVGDKDFTITITYAVYTPSPDDVKVMGVSLDITSKEIAIGESFTLKATVTPSNATMKSVSWSSSDESVATVNANGVVTALKVGSCKITVATDDGNKTASCVVTVSTTVGIERIQADHKVYTERGAIVVNPSRRILVQVYAVTGVKLYDSSVGGSTRIPVASGIYMVRLMENGTSFTTKVNVH